MGRPRKADRKAVVSAICASIAAGGFVRDAVDEHHITRQTLHAWLREDAELSDAYARAREDQAHAWAEAALVVANGEDPLTEAREDAIEKYADEIAGETNAAQKIRALQNNLIQRDKLRVDTLKWMASKLAPKLYGERQTLAGDADDPVRMEVVFVAEGAR